MYLCVEMHIYFIYLFLILTNTTFEKLLHFRLVLTCRISWWWMQSVNYSMNWLVSKQESKLQFLCLLINSVVYLLFSVAEVWNLVTYTVCMSTGITLGFSETLGEGSSLKDFLTSPDVLWWCNQLTCIFSNLHVIDVVWQRKN